MSPGALMDGNVMADSPNSFLTLRNGKKIPPIGLGTYSLKGETLRVIMSEALAMGYRLFDSATFYENEAEMGEILHTSAIPREDIFIVSKVWNTDQGYETTLKSVESSLRRLQTDYIDLYLIHWPVPVIRQETWRALQHLYKEGKLQAIGVCNYYIPHLEEMMRTADIPPMVNQIELSPYLYLPEVLEFCAQFGIVIQAYAPLTNGYKLHDPKLLQIAQRYEKTPAQILLRWSLQHGAIPIPKSAHVDRIRQNFDVFNFSLTKDDMALLDSFHIDLHTDWNPTDVR